MFFDELVHQYSGSHICGAPAAALGLDRGEGDSPVGAGDAEEASRTLAPLPKIILIIDNPRPPHPLLEDTRIKDVF